MSFIPDESDKIESLRALIKDNDNIVAMLGVGMEIECGLKNLFSSEECYRIEEEYGLSPEELFSAAFYTTKKQKFYNFYKKEILDREASPGPGYFAVKKLQEMAKYYGYDDIKLQRIKYRKTVTRLLLELDD